MITSADGSQVWVTARESDDLLCFSAARLATDPARALTAIVRVGEAPVGLALVRQGTQVVVTDSDRFNGKGATADLEVVGAGIGGLAACLPGDALSLATTVTAVEPGSTDARVTTSAGELEADLVVAADGIGSAVRTTLFPRHAGLRYAGFTTWRMLVGPVDGRFP